MSRHFKSLAQKYPPSDPCSCKICLGYCKRPGWWTVKEAEAVVSAGHSRWMMLEVSPELTLGVLSPAFRGCEGSFAFHQFASLGCGFLYEGLCTLHGTGFQPLECRFCHHDRVGLGAICHADLEKDWSGTAGRKLVERWCRLFGFWDSLDFYGLSRIKKIENSR